MTPKQRAALEADGWHFGTVQQLLGLTDAEMAEVEAAVESFVTETEDDYDAQAEMDLLLIRDLYGDG